jgi:hypothetical protein
MTQQEFKEILESIEVGLYELWEYGAKHTHRWNFDKDNCKKRKRFYTENRIQDYISLAFIWGDYGQSANFWNKVDNKYREILKDKKLI